MYPEVPLVVPEVNPEDVKKHRGIIANPNCSTVIALVPLKPLHDYAGIRRVIVSTYQAVSGLGIPGIRELTEQSLQVIQGEPVTPSVFKHQIAFNVIPHIERFEENGFTYEEMKMLHEGRKILHCPELLVNCTCVRVPVIRSHSESITIETERKLTADKARELLASAPGVKLAGRSGFILIPDAGGRLRPGPGLGRAHPGGLYRVQFTVPVGERRSGAKGRGHQRRSDRAAGGEGTGRSMNIVVQKFGGTSTNTPAARALLCERARQRMADGYHVVGVVSGMGRRGDPYATDTLLEMLYEVNPDVSLREMDMIAVCAEQIGGAVVAAHLQREGIRARYLTGQQAGIWTTGTYIESELKRFDPSRILELLSEGAVPLVGSGQGVGEKNEITMLGRGGGDTTAAILGVGLGATCVEIFTDVDGVLTADPRIVPGARLIPRISFQNCADMARSGAKVMHPRAVEIAAERPEMALFVRGLGSGDAGTLICRSDSGTPCPVGVASQQGELLVDEPADGVLADACRARGLEPVPAAMPGDLPRFALGAKDARRFRYLLNDMGAAPRVRSGLTRVSLIGDQLDCLPGAFDEFFALTGGAAAYRLTPGCLTAWVDGDGVQAIRRVHRTFIEGD